MRRDGGGIARRAPAFAVRIAVADRAVLAILAVLVSLPFGAPDSASAAPFEPTGDPLPADFVLDREMLRGMHAFLDAGTESARLGRERWWAREDAAVDSVEAIVDRAMALRVEAGRAEAVRAALRARLRRMLGADPHLREVAEDAEFHLEGTLARPSRIGRGEGVSSAFSIHEVRLPALEGVDLRGLLLVPDVPARSGWIAIPDADDPPELLAGLPVEGRDPLPPGARFAAILASDGHLVFVPSLLDRSDEFSGNPAIDRMTNQSHREFVQRLAYEMGTTLAGLEVAMIERAIPAMRPVRAATSNPEADEGPMSLGVVGCGEGGRLALYLGALNETVDCTVVSGAFGPREGTWSEPLDRNAWRYLEEFGDAGVARLVYPRSLFVEAVAVPRVEGPPPVRDGRRGAAPGGLRTPPLEAVERELALAAPLWKRSGDEARIGVIRGDESGDAPTVPGAGRPDPFARLGPSDPAATRDLGSALRGERAVVVTADPGFERLTKERRSARMADQVRELVGFTQRLMETAHRDRDAYWNARVPAMKAGGVVDMEALSSLHSSPSTPSIQSVHSTPSIAPHPLADAWDRAIAPMRHVFHEEILGALPRPVMPIDPRVRFEAEEPAFRTWTVVLDTWPIPKDSESNAPSDESTPASDAVIAGGLLLLPTDLAPGERRPVVVCQHGLEGTPADTIDPANPYYDGFSAELARRGYIVFAPQNPYRGEDAFRSIQRKANPLGLSLFSFIVGQHARILDWLGTLPFVDPARIGFYGLSYGGKTAMRVPAIETRYALSICSADFNDWIRKNVSTDHPYGYVFTGEYEMPEFDLGRTFNYAEMARMIAPRPFMVERGHFDGVAPPEWVAAEYARVKFHYDQLGIGDRTEMETFLGPHTIHGEGTFAFLDKWLGPPRR